MDVQQEERSGGNVEPCQKWIQKMNHFGEKRKNEIGFACFQYTATK